ncbi:hypothetical protein DICSQDRAFT_182967, partial [Dichomitus squalens LYAD-421 SS1]
MPFSSLSAPPPTVAVGHGWLSDALTNDNSPFILGTLCSDGIYPDSIEVIFSLKQFPRPPPSRANSSVPDRKPTKRTHGALFTTDPLRWPAQEKLKASDHLTPPVIQDPLLSGFNPSLLPTVLPPVKQDTPSQLSTLPNLTMSLPAVHPLEPPSVAPQSASQGIPAQVLLAALAGSQENHQRLLSLIGSIDSTSSNSEPSPELVQMIRALLSSAAPSVAPSATVPSPSVSVTHVSSSVHVDPYTPLTFLSATAPSSAATSFPAEASQSPPAVIASASSPPTTDHTIDDEIMVLDKENVNPVAFRRKGNEKEKPKETALPQHRTSALRLNQSEPVLRSRASTSENAT